MKQHVLILFTMFSFSAIGQQDLTVTIFDYLSKTPLSDVSITLENVPRNIIITQATNQKGKSVFKNILSVNEYQVRFDSDGVYKAQKSAIIDVRSNQNTDITLYLEKEIGISGDLDEIVLTYRTSGKINRQNAEVSFELKSTEIQEIPVEGRDLTRVLYRLPNVTQATGFYPEAPNVSINGANGLYASYLIDGLDNNERFLGGQKFNIPTGFAKDITVLTSNFSAEYGLTGSGIIDITPKAGSNETKGEVFFINRPGPELDGTSPFAQRDLSGNFVKEGFARYQVGTGIGGAIKKDKTFYYLNFEHTTDVKDNLLRVSELGVNETVRGTNYFNYTSAKIDHIWSPNFRTSLRGNVGIVGIERQGGGLDGGVIFNSAGNTQDRNSTLIAFKNTYIFGRISGETNLQYSYFKWGYANPVNPISPQVVVRNADDQTIAILGHPGYVFDAIENTTQVQQKFKYYMDNHTLKVGLNYIRGNHILFGGGNPNGNYTVRLNAEQHQGLKSKNLGNRLNVNDLPSDVEVLNYNVELRPASFGASQSIFSVYLEDLWSFAEKLNLTIGLRYDYDNLSKGGSDKGDFNNLAPRMNVNYKLTNNSSLRGGYGIVYDKISYAIFSDALQQNTTSTDYKKQLQQLKNLGLLPANTNIGAITFDGNISGNLSNVGYLQGPSGDQLQNQRASAFSNERRILNPEGYQNPSSQQFSIGYQSQIDDNRLFFVDLVYNRGENLIRLRNLNAAAEYNIDPENVMVRTPEEADASRPIPIINGSAIIDGKIVSGVARNVIVSESAGESKYYAASFNYQKSRGNDNYSYRINYTLSSLKNNTEDINFRAMDANNYLTEWGPSINDRTHNINGILSYYPLAGTTVTLAGIIQSGQPVNRIPFGFGTTDLNGDGSGFGDAYVGNSDRFPGESRNSDRLPWSTTFDLGIQHQFTLSVNGKLELRADVFNVFNAENLSGYSNNATQSNQIQAGSAASGLFVQRNAGPPRQFQFSVRYLF
ncbi:MAG: TonB-dependent receptor [Saprospiraceae bacterium]|nr:TonB-dependent receptor [Saprospiraceae bacterium]